VFNIVLYCPEIPGNTGTIGRTCVALGLKLHIIHPISFDLSEKAVRRAGLDYWKHVQLYEYENWNDFLNKTNPENLIYFSRFAEKTYYQAPYQEDCFLVFGSETSGLPKEVVEIEKSYSLPSFSEHIRSLNLSNTVTAAAYESLRQIKNP
jgi:tRNA (cytidine/uridine-2'-O-)-methyltransferase